MIKRVIKRILNILLTIFVIGVVIIGFLLITEFSPKNGETLKMVGKSTEKLKKNSELTIITYNIGHLISSKDETCFLEGGTEVRPTSKEIVTTNLDKVNETIKSAKADIVLLQEVDYKSKISYDVNEYVKLSNEFEGVSSFATEQETFVPYPVLDMVGNVKTGIATLSKYEGISYRLTLPQDYEFFERLFEPKKCLQKTVIGVDGTDKALVIINVDLEDYDNGSIRKEQLKALLEEMKLEYEKGNYVIAGGDFNMLFVADEAEEYISDTYSITKMDKELLPKDWQVITGKDANTFRLRNKKYDVEATDDVVATVDGFIATPNIQVKKTTIIDTKFENSNHNPVKIEIKLK